MHLKQSNISDGDKVIMCVCVWCLFSYDVFFFFLSCVVCVFFFFLLGSKMEKKKNVIGMRHGQKRIRGACVS